MQGRPVGDLGHNPQVHLHSRAQHHRRAGLSPGDNMVYILVADEVRHDVSPSFDRHQNIQIADGFLPASVAAGHSNVFDGIVFFEIVNISPGDFFGHHPLGAGFTPAAALDFLQDRGLGFGAESLEFANFLFLGGFFQRRKISDIQRLIQGLDLFGSQPRDAQQVLQPRW